MKNQVPSDLKNSNRKLVYSYIKNKPGQTVSRPELSKKLSITEPTIMKITNFFMERSIVIEIGEADVTTVGRKPNILAFNPNAAYCVGAYYNGTKFSIAILNLNNDVIAFNTRKVSVPLDELLLTTMPYELKNLNVNHLPLIGLGLALPGIIDIHQNTVHMKNPIIELNGVNDYSNVVRELSSKIGMAVYLENEVNAAALNFAKKLNQCRSNDLIYVRIDAGLGAGIVFDGKLRRGRHYTAGEIGYVSYDKEFPPEESRFLDSQLGYRYLKENYGLDIMVDKISENKLEPLLNYIARDIALLSNNLAVTLDVSDFVIGGYLVEKFGSALLDRIEEYKGQCPLFPINYLLDTESDTIAKGMGAIVADIESDSLIADD